VNRVYGPVDHVRPWSTVDHSTELTGAWPPAAHRSLGGRDGEWNVGNPMVHSPELGRQRGGQATVVRVAAIETPVRSALRLGEWEMGGGDGCGEEG
jgi:hypothetical protein